MNEETKELMACFNDQFEALMLLHMSITEIDREITFDGACDEYMHLFIKAQYNRRCGMMQARKLTMNEQEKQAWKNLLEHYNKKQ